MSEKTREVINGGAVHELKSAKIKSTSELSDLMTDLFWEALEAVIHKEIEENELDAWKERRLSRVYLVGWLETIPVKVRLGGEVQHRPVRILVGLNLRGIKELLGIWCTPVESPSFWATALADLRRRGLENILLMSLDQPQGYIDAAKRFSAKKGTNGPEAQIFLQVHGLLGQVARRDRKPISGAMRKWMDAPDLGAADRLLEGFEAMWPAYYNAFAAPWRAHVLHLKAFYAFPQAVRKMIAQPHPAGEIPFAGKKSIRARARLAGEHDLEKYVYASLMKDRQNWTSPVKDWPSVLVQFVHAFGEDRASIRIW